MEMEDRKLATRLQRRIGILVAVMAGVIAITPLALAIALRSSSNPLRSGMLIAATLLWLLAFVMYRGLSTAHDQWRRRVLRQEIADARNARVEASELFQDRLNEQNAILDRIRDISHGILEVGILDPNLTLSSVNLISSHAFEAQGLIEDAVAEVRVETGSATFTFESLDVRSEVEEIAAPFIRSGHTITTDGPQYFAETDAAVFRLVLRGLVSGAIESGAPGVEISLARDDDKVVCTVADNGRDRSDLGLAAVSPVLKSLSFAVGADLAYNRLLGRNQYSFSAPEAAVETRRFKADPIDVLGALSPKHPVEEKTAPLPVNRPHLEDDDLIGFLEAHDRDRAQSVAARRKSQAVAR